jgi:hypothetical protein
MLRHKELIFTVVVVNVPTAGRGSSFARGVGDWRIDDLVMFNSIGTDRGLATFIAR